MQQKQVTNPTKEFFLQAMFAQYEVEELLQKHEHYLDLATRISSSIGADAVRSTEMHDKVGDAAVKLVDLANKLEQRARRFVALAEQAEAVIEQLPRQRHRELMSRRYVLLQSWSEIAEAMRYENVSGVHKAHGRALIAARDILAKSVHCFPRGSRDIM